MDLKSLVTSKLKMVDGVLILNQPEPEEETVRVNTLDLSVDANAVRQKMTTISREARHEAYKAFMASEQDKAEVEEEVRTDAITINDGKAIEVAAVKAFNSAMNRVSDNDYLYGVVSLTVSIQEHDEVSILELKDPSYHSEITKLKARDKIRMVEGQAIRNMNSVGFKLSTIIPVDEEGAFEFQDSDTFNKILDHVNDFKSNYSKAVNGNLAARVGAEDVYTNQLAIKNKGRIRKYVNSTLPDDMDTYERRQLVIQKMGEIFNATGVKPLTSKTLEIILQVDKIHYAPSGTFASKAENVSILQDDAGHELKIERTQMSQQFKLPYVEEVLKTQDLVAIETLFAYWAENEVRVWLGHDKLEIPKVTIAPWTFKDLKVSEDLKISEESKNKIFRQIEDKIEQAIKMDQINNLA